MMDFIQDAEDDTIDIPRQRLKRKAPKNHGVASKKARVEQSYEEGEACRSGFHTSKC